MKNYTPIEREDLIEEWSHSGLSKREFCRNNKISYTTFMGWIRRKNIPKAAAGFVKIDTPAAKQSSTSMITLEKHDLRVHIPEQTPAETIKALIEMLGACHVN